jgi:predicted RNA-binding Zn ribbon-like protein
MKKIQKVQFRRDFELSGGALCLDFANTVSNRKISWKRWDELTEYSDLLAFATQSLYLPVELAREFLTISRAEPRATARAMEDARKLREAIYRVFTAYIERRQASVEDLTLIRDVMIESWKHKRLAPVGRRYLWLTKQEEGVKLESVLWPIASSAADLLTSDRLQKVRMCEADTCAWLFLDESRNHSRRWCDMKVCGNREKARRHYQREHR